MWEFGGVKLLINIQINNFPGKSWVPVFAKFI